MPEIQEISVEKCSELIDLLSNSPASAMDFLQLHFSLDGSNTDDSGVRDSYILQELLSASQLGLQLGFGALKMERWITIFKRIHDKTITGNVKGIESWVAHFEHEFMLPPSNQRHISSVFDQAELRQMLAFVVQGCGQHLKLIMQVFRKPQEVGLLRARIYHDPPVFDTLPLSQAQSRAKYVESCAKEDERLNQELNLQKEAQMVVLQKQELDKKILALNHQSAVLLAKQVDLELQLHSPIPKQEARTIEYNTLFRKPDDPRPVKLQILDNGYVKVKKVARKKGWLPSPPDYRESKPLKDSKTTPKQAVKVQKTERFEPIPPKQQLARQELVAVVKKSMDTFFEEWKLRVSEQLEFEAGVWEERVDAILKVKRERTLEIIRVAKEVESWEPKKVEDKKSVKRR